MAEYSARKEGGTPKLYSDGHDDLVELTAICWVHRVKPRDVIGAVWRLHQTRNWAEPLHTNNFIGANPIEIARRMAIDNEANSEGATLRVANQIKQFYELYKLEREMRGDNVVALRVIAEHELWPVDLVYRMAMLIDDTETVAKLATEAKWLLRIQPQREKALFKGANK